MVQLWVYSCINNTSVSNLRDIALRLRLVHVTLKLSDM